MPYLTVTQLHARLANAGGAGARTASELPDERLAEHAADAETVVVGRLARHFTLTPPDSDDPAPPGLLRAIIADIAGYTATLEWYGSQPLEERDPVVLRHERARRLLEDIATGRVTVDGITDASAGAVNGDAAVFNSAPAVNLTREAPLPTYGVDRWAHGVWG